MGSSALEFLSVIQSHSLGLQLVSVQATSEREIDEAVGSLIQQRAAALIVSGDTTFYGRREQIAKLASRHHKVAQVG
jgi:hypothetical protein